MAWPLGLDSAQLCSLTYLWSVSEMALFIHMVPHSPAVLPVPFSPTVAGESAKRKSERIQGLLRWRLKTGTCLFCCILLSKASWGQPRSMKEGSWLYFSWRGASVTLQRVRIEGKLWMVTTIVFDKSHHILLPVLLVLPKLVWFTFCWLL